MSDLERRHTIQHSADAVVIGSGIAGLTIAHRFARDGYRVAVVEKSSYIANGQTTKNEGWLHKGPYHSVNIREPHQARQVTEHTIFGHEYILGFASEAVEKPIVSSFALFQSDELAHTAETRWEAFGVERKEIPVKNFLARVPEVDGTPIKSVFEVGDKSINTSKLCEILVKDITNHGGTIFTNTQLVPVDTNHADLITNGELAEIQSGLFVVTAGAGIKRFVEDATG